VRPTSALSPLVVSFGLGPAFFLVGFWRQAGRGIRVSDDLLKAAERRAGLRESAVFFVGAGSSMAMQFLPVVIAGRLQATTVAALLFGALQATTPLLLLSRIYGTIMMPTFAGAASDQSSQRHLTLIRPFFLPSLALALGIAPWIPVSLGVKPDVQAIVIGALVALMTLLQVWATPAVTVLSARRQELVPAASSLGGLIIACGVWAIGIKAGEIMLLPVGLALGAVARSLVPMWVISGYRIGRVDSDTSRLLVLAAVMTLGTGLLASLGSLAAMSWGGLLIAAGVAFGIRMLHTARAHEAPAR